ncbi:MAG: Tryptophan--tRNA ligase, mitochondrial [Lichina confinis]|nr:MAG: Tryptophan--tRNA ligase, mitochondrial [Lichina confinis]
MSAGYQPQPARSYATSSDEFDLGTALGGLPTNLEPTTSSRPSAGDIEKQLVSQHLESKQKPVSEQSTAVAMVREAAEEELRLPRSVQALYLAPLKRRAEYGVPTCDLQLRSYSVHNLTFFADFALRAAYYLKLPASGPIPLPRLRQLWTVPRSNFVHKKSQENFERITMRRLIQIKDGHPDAVEIWLAFLTKHQYHGVGMKANVWDFERLDVGKTLDTTVEEMGAGLESKWAQFGQRKASSLKRSFQAAAAPPVAPPPGSVIFSGIQPTGIPHIGNYLGALREWVRLVAQAEPSTKFLFSIVDLHAMTVGREREPLWHARRQTLATLLAMGLDPERCVMFYQSAVPAHCELMWMLSCTASMGHLARMTQWKNKSLSMNDASAAGGPIGSSSRLGLFSYPVLQAADVLVHRYGQIAVMLSCTNGRSATHVPVGEDQAQHLEFARRCVGGFNHTHGNILVRPETILSPAKRVMSLRNPVVKMSKSDPDRKSRVLLTDTPESIRATIKGALTDSCYNRIFYDRRERPGIANLLEIWSHFDEKNRSPETLALEHQRLIVPQFKERVSDAIIDGLAGIRQEYTRVVNADEGRYVDYVANKGVEKARQSAEQTMELVREAVGLSPSRGLSSNV